MRGSDMMMVVCFTGNSGLTDYSVSLCRELQRHTATEFVTATSYDESRYGGAMFAVTRLFRRSRHYPVDMIRFVRHVLARRPRWLVFQSILRWAWLDAGVVELLRAAGIRCALTIHDLLPHYPRRWSARERALFYNRFDALVVHSRRQARELAALGVNRAPLIVPHGVYDIFNVDGLTREQARSRLSEIGADDVVALFFGHLEERKGILDFLECARQLQSRPGLKFVVAGSPEKNAKVTAALDEVRGLPNVLVHDQRVPHERVQWYFAASDVVVLPYREGTTSGVLKLAMAFGKPVFWTDIGDVAESLADWPGGSIDRDQIAADLSVKMGRLLELPRSAASGVTVPEEMKWDRIAARYVEYLDRMGT